MLTLCLFDSPLLRDDLTLCPWSCVGPTPPADASSPQGEVAGSTRSFAHIGIGNAWLTPGIPAVESRLDQGLSSAASFSPQVSLSATVQCTQYQCTALETQA